MQWLWKSTSNNKMHLGSGSKNKVVLWCFGKYFLFDKRYLKEVNYFSPSNSPWFSLKILSRSPVSLKRQKQIGRDQQNWLVSCVSVGGWNTKKTFFLFQGWLSWDLDVLGIFIVGRPIFEFYKRNISVRRNVRPKRTRSISVLH